MIVDNSAIGSISESSINARYLRSDLDELMSQPAAKLIAAYNVFCKLDHGDDTGKYHVVALAHTGDKTLYIIDKVALPCPPHCHEKGDPPYDFEDLVLMSTYITELLTEPSEGFTRDFD